MEKRLTSQGPKSRQSFTATLPKEWVLREKLDKTKTIEMEVVGNKVIISPEKDMPDRIGLRVNSFKRSYIKVLPALYRMGVDEIILKFDDELLLKEIYNLINSKLIGFEVMEQKGSILHVKYIMKESEEDFKIVLRRIFLLTLEIAETHSKIKADALNDNIDKLCNYCQRILIKKGHLEYTKIPFYYQLLDYLEKLSDEIAKFLNCKYRSNKHEGTFKKLGSNLNLLYKVFYKFNIEELDLGTEQTYKIKKEIESQKEIDTPTMHLHNYARLLNSMQGVIFPISFNTKSNPAFDF